MAFTLLYSANGRAENKKVESQTVLAPLQFRLEGSHYPSYSVFKGVLSAQMFSAKQRICILTQNFEDRELAFVLFNASRRALAAQLRVEPKLEDLALRGRLGRLLDDLRALGLSVSEASLKKLKLPKPTIIAIDNRAWSVSSELSELENVVVVVEAAPFTAAEVCGWAEAAPSGAKPATQR